MRVQNVAALAFLAAAWCAPALADAADIENSYRQAAEHVQKHAKDYWLDGKPSGERALSRSWTLLADWTATYLNEHPGATPRLLKHASPAGDLDVVPLGPRTMLVSGVVGDAFGTIFIVDGSDGPYRPVWSIRGRAGREAFPLLDAWTAKGAAEGCRKEVGDLNQLRCGSVGGAAHRLPDDARAHPRFYVQANYAEMAGNTVAEQLSFWTWNGTKAEPQFVTTFGTNLDDDPTRFDGTLLKVRIAESYRMISPWWDHLDREIDWVFRVGPDRIDDLGRNPVVPEVDVVDELLFRTAHRLPADDLATREVQADVGRIIAQARDDDARYGETGDPSLSMDGSAGVHHRDGGAQVCLPTEEQGLLIFTLTGSFVSDLSVKPEGSANDCPSGKP